MPKKEVGRTHNRMYRTLLKMSNLFSVDYDEARRTLNSVKNTMLDNVECGNGDCTRIVVSSHGAPLMRHPPRYMLPVVRLSTDIDASEVRRSVLGCVSQSSTAKEPGANTIPVALKRNND